MMNNFRKVIAAVIVFTMISGALLVIIPSAGQSAEADTLAYPDQIAMYAEPEFRDRKATDLQPAGSLVAKSGESMLVNNTPLNTTMPFVTSGTFWDNTSSAQPGYEGAEWYDAFNVIDITKRGEGEHCEVWVADDLSYYNGTADPRDSMTEILDWQVDYIMDEFDNNIYPVMTETFIDAPALNGSNPGLSTWRYVFNNNTLTLDNITDMLFPTNDTGKMMIVIFNMIDENWYDGYACADHRAYTAGYYWSLIRSMYDRNIMHIDCYDWIDRIGDNVTRKYLYESTVAHEYQHLLHDEMDGDEEAWVNEGLSMMAEFLCGYGISYDHIAEFVWYPDNSLTIWGDQDWMGASQILADYGAVALFDLYLYDHFGGTEMLQEIFTSQLQGIDGVNEAFLNMGYNRLSFDAVYRYWRLANLFTFNMMDTDNPLYTYDPELITIFDVGRSIYGEEVPAGYHWDRFQDVWSAQYGFPYYLQAYGTDYYAIPLSYEDWSVSGPRYSEMMYSKFWFDGDDSIRTGWQYQLNELAGTTYVPAESWYSGSGIDEADLLLTQEVDLTTPTEDGTHTLVLSTYWDIEEQWDFGFVQVSVDGGATWTSLNDTTDFCRSDVVEGGYPEIIANMPGLTGTSGGVVDVVFDLSAYDGQEILVGYRYMTDWGYTAEGWYISDVNVDGADVAMDTLINPPTPEADFMVTIVVPTENGWLVIDVPSLDDTEVAQKLLASISSAEVMFLLVSSNNGPVNYEFDVFERGEDMNRRD